MCAGSVSACRLQPGEQHIPDRCWYSVTHDGPALIQHYTTCSRNIAYLGMTEGGGVGEGALFVIREEVPLSYTESRMIYYL